MQVQIKYISGTRESQVASFEQFVVNIGANKDNDIVLNLPEDSDVAGHHLQLRQRGETAILEDLGTMSGTFLNDRKVQKATVNNGDTVRLGASGPAFQIFVSFFDKPQRAAIPTSASSHTSEHTSKSQKLYGKRTLGMLIAQALKSADAIKTGMYKSTDYIEAMMENKLNARTRPYKILLISAFVMVLLSLGTLAFFWLHNDDNAKNSAADAGAPVAQYNKNNIYLLAGQNKSTKTAPKGFCTAFAISPNILATNAHCVRVAQSEYTHVYALQNESPKHRYEVIKMHAHDKYDPSRPSADVAVLQTQAMMPQFAPVADESALRALMTGQTIYMYGFPGRLSNLADPVASFVGGNIGRITSFAQNVQDHQHNVLLQHSAPNSHGNSGSPVFNHNGQVVGINAGGYMENGEPLYGYNFAVRIDMIKPLINQLLDKESNQ